MTHRNFKWLCWKIFSFRSCQLFVFRLTFGVGHLASLEVHLVIRINIVPCLRVMKVKKIFWNLICLGWNNVRNIKSQSLWYWLCFLCEILPQFVENRYKVNTRLCFIHYVSNIWSSKSCFYFCILSYFNTFFSMIWSIWLGLWAVWRR